MFKFNFDGDEYNEIHGDQEVQTPAKLSPLPSGLITEIECPHIDPCSNIIKTSIQWNHIHIDVLVDRDDERDSDLIPGEYEGGKKVWECSLDLASYVLEQFADGTGQDAIALELGCGHGIPGIAALKCGFRYVLFTDFNDYVLRQATWPSIVANSENDKSIQCFAGDWAHLSYCLQQNTINAPNRYNLIVSAETLYSTETLEKVGQFIRHHLAIPNGMALLASKRYYFGVGGGVRDFQRHMELFSDMECVIVKSFDDGFSNVRDIVRVQWRHGPTEEKLT